MSGPPSEGGPKRWAAGKHDARQPTAVGRSGPRRRVLAPVAVVLVVFVLCGAVWSVPEARSVLRDSFTERQQAYTELYFGKEPFLQGHELVVPLRLVEHGESGGRHPVRVWVQDAKGHRLASRTETVTTKPGALISVDVRLRFKGSAELVEVTLPGHPQRLRTHLR
ncbi:hypothetical protein GT028_18850 [Streptomyces sp. SID2999]|uniref:hypothetical protein n=1 Tax=Streptomyces TaxID=1883 RepID=UPI00136F5B82|nr:hypothetical protein [Streptomyces sp. SID2999]MYZ09414.1 hypothetical protein [Streptomyces sp. SID2999]